MGSFAKFNFDYSVVCGIAEVSEITQLIGHDAAVNVAKFSPNGQWIASGGDDNQFFSGMFGNFEEKPECSTNCLKGHLGK